MQSPSFLFLLVLATGAQRPERETERELPEIRITHTPELPPSWYRGDTHEHIQYCDNSEHALFEVLGRMQAEDQNVANVLIWDRRLLPFSQYVCLVSGSPDPITRLGRIVQFGVETSGLDCAKWGHLSGLGIGPDEARIARASLANGDCLDADGLGLGCPGGDGTGAFNAPIAQHFLRAPGAVCGLAHTAWTVGLHHPDGFDWQTELLASGFTTDAYCLDPSQRLAVPPLGLLLGIGGSHSPLDHGNEGLGIRPFFPLLGAMDAVLGNVQFVETTVMGKEVPVTLSPPAHWTEMYYKLLSAGVRIGFSGGSDRACSFAGTTSEHPRTIVRVDENLSYAAWIEGLAAGRTTLALTMAPFLRLTVGGQEVGGDVGLAASDPRVSATVELQTGLALQDFIELVVDGEVRETLAVDLPERSSASFSFEDLLFLESSWVAARLRSQRSHSAAVHVIVDGQPIADCRAAEYWMLWCDIVTKSTLDHPELQFFDCQEAEVLALIATARRAFKALRDIEGFDASWGVTRFGRSTPACRGPIAIGTTGPLPSSEPFLLTCVNAPIGAQGQVYVSRADDPKGTCYGEVRLFVDPDPSSLLGLFPATATRSGYAEVKIPPLPPGEAVIYAQFVWTNPPACPGTSCIGGPSALSASDALKLVVQ